MSIYYFIKFLVEFFVSRKIALMETMKVNSTYYFYDELRVWHKRALSYLFYSDKVNGNGSAIFGLSSLSSFACHYI